jgi:hypothetical protein
MLPVGAGDAHHQRVPVQSGPGAALKVAEAECLLQRLVGLFANPARLDRAGEVPPGRAERQIGQAGFALARGAPLAHQPDLIVRQMAVGASDRTVATSTRAQASRAETAPFVTNRPCLVCLVMNLHDDER